MKNEITLNDIAAAVQLIDIVTSRGAFKGAELMEVATLRGRFVAYVEDANKEAANAPDQDPKGEPEKDK